MKKKMFISHPLIKKDSVNLRSYQEAVVSRAIDANTLVVLPTGLGKTIVALMVAAHRLNKYPKSKILFLAPTRPLVVQHQKSFKKFLLIEDQIVLTGRDKPTDRNKLFKDNQCIFATPQTIENDIYRGLDLNDVSLVVFDEAHRATGDYSYVGIAEEYKKKAKNPLVLALTASPSSKEETITEICANLGITRVEAKTDKDRDVKPYVQDTKVRWVRVELPAEFKKVKVLLEDVIKTELKQLKIQGHVDSISLSKLNKRKLLGLQTNIRAEITQGKDSYLAASLVAGVIKLNHALELLETQGISALNEYFKRMGKQKTKVVGRLWSDDRMRRILKLVADLNVLGLDHPKLDHLVKIVKPYRGKKVLIFTQYRDSVNKIIDRLNEADLLVHEFIGQSARGSKKGMTQKKQIQILDKFRAGDFTALVATSVAEEGLDIPAVDLVIFYEPIPSEIRTIQRRGRTGRQESGEVVVLMAKGTRDEGYYWSSVHKEAKMGKLVSEMKSDFDTNRGQKKLGDYGVVEDSKPEVKVIVDVRERNTTILKTLKNLCNIDLKQLPVGDFILSDRVGVERKTITDFLSSLIDKRLMTQALELRRTYEIPLMILEGRDDIYTQRGIHANAIRGALSSLAVDLGIHIIPSKDEEDTANIVFQIAKREQLEEERLVAVRGERTPLSLSDRQLFLVEGLPNVSAVLARRMLEQFGTVERIMKASEKELQDVEGIGKGKAEEIRKVLKHKYRRS
ncbi:MAG: DEAD/DEAH box helicase [Candidatus Altiarchaeota archaeon]